MPYTAIDNLPPVHPGEILKDELEALNMSARKFAEHIHVPPNAVTAILNGGRGVSAQMALRLGPSVWHWAGLLDASTEHLRGKARAFRISGRTGADCWAAIMPRYWPAKSKHCLSPQHSGGKFRMRWRGLAKRSRFTARSPQESPISKPGCPAGRRWTSSRSRAIQTLARRVIV